MNPITVTDIQTTPPPARPRFYGYMRLIAEGWYGGIRPKPFDDELVTFVVPTDRENELRREREKKVLRLLWLVENFDSQAKSLLVSEIRELDRQIEEASK